jgi:hypothetical protein
MTKYHREIEKWARPNVIWHFFDCATVATDFIPPQQQQQQQQQRQQQQQCFLAVRGRVLLARNTAAMMTRCERARLGREIIIADACSPITTHAAAASAAAAAADLYNGDRLFLPLETLRGRAS